MKDNKIYTCLWCWFITLERLISEDEICHICGMQETSYWIEKPFTIPFKNGITLFDCQQEILKKIPQKEQTYTRWKTIYLRNPLWKPINEEKIDKNYNYFPTYKYKDFVLKWPEYDGPYKKIYEEAQKYNPDDKVHLNL